MRVEFTAIQGSHYNIHLMPETVKEATALNEMTANAKSKSVRASLSLHDGGMLIQVDRVNERQAESFLEKKL